MGPTRTILETLLQKIKNIWNGFWGIVGWVWSWVKYIAPLALIFTMILMMLHVWGPWGPMTRIALGASLPLLARFAGWDTTKQIAALVLIGGVAVGFLEWAHVVRNESLDLITGMIIGLGLVAGVEALKASWPMRKAGIVGCFTHMMAMGWSATVTMFIVVATLYFPLIGIWRAYGGLSDEGLYILMSPPRWFLEFVFWLLSLVGIS